MTVKLTADGRTMLRASYGRFSQGVLTGEFSAFHPGVDADHDHRFRSADRRLHAHRLGGRSQDQSAPGSRTCAHRIRTSIPLVWIARSVAGSQWRSPTFARMAPISSAGPTSAVSIARDTQTLPDGTHHTVFELVNASAARRFLLTNPDGYSMTYNGLVLAVEKRRIDGWQAFGSYTLSRAVGLQPSSGTTAAGAQVSTVAPPNRARSGAIPTISPTRAADCQTIDRTCSVPWARSTCHGPASWLPPICRSSAASRGRHRAGRAAAGRPAHPARAAWLAPAVVAIAARCAAIEDDRVGRRGTHRPALRRAQRAQRHSGRRPGL